MKNWFQAFAFKCNSHRYNEASRVGLVPAQSEGGGEGEAPRMAWKPSEHVMVSEGDAFIMVGVVQVKSS